MAKGRPSKYTDDLADKICGRIANGESVLSIANEKGMPSQDTIYAWVRNKPNFSEKYARARELQAELYLDQIVEIADNSTDDIIFLATQDSEGESGKPAIKASAINRARLQIDTRKWAMARLAPKKYGDKTTVAGDEENPLELKHSGAIDLTPSEAYQRMLDGR